MRLKKVKCFDFIKSKKKKKKKKVKCFFRIYMDVGKADFSSHTKRTAKAKQVFTSFMCDNMEYLEF